MSRPAYESIPLERFQEVFKDTSTGRSLGISYHSRSVANDVNNCGMSFLEVSSVALGGKIVSFSDEFFAEASNLLKVHVSSLTALPTCYRTILTCFSVRLGSPLTTALGLHEGSVWTQRSLVRWLGDQTTQCP
jgi:hypothetical protein